MDNYKKSTDVSITESDWGYQSISKYYHNNCNCDNPNCQGACRCNCKGYWDDTSSSSCSNSSSTSNNMCNSVFGPICEPEVCDIPRFPHSQDLVVGNGTICGNQACFSEETTEENTFDKKPDYECETDCEHGCYDEETDCLKQYRFTIHIYREFTAHLGEFVLYDGLGKLILSSNKLECYHAPTENNMVAIFHVVLEDGTSREIIIYAKNKTCESLAALYVYSAPLFDTEIKIGSALLQGELNIYPDKMGHDH